VRNRAIDLLPTPTQLRHHRHADPTGRVASEGKFDGAFWDTLATYVYEQELAEQVDRELESLAKAFGLQGAPDQAPVG
jgi:hypothetical protein